MQYSYTTCSISEVLQMSRKCFCSSSCKSLSEIFLNKLIIYSVLWRNFCANARRNVSKDIGCQAHSPEFILEMTFFFTSILSLIKMVQFDFVEKDQMKSEFCYIILNRKIELCVSIFVYRQRYQYML